jgi:hypothetical protein
MKTAKSLSAVNKITSQREKINKHNRIVMKMRTKKERIKKLGVGM